MPENTLLVLTTAPDQDTAERLASYLVEQKLAACVNISPPITSVYRWQEKIERDTEHSLMIKTSRARYDALQTAIQKQHPYELPEIVAVPLQRGLPAYLEWIEACTQD